jgi:TIR domain
MTPGIFISSAPADEPLCLQLTAMLERHGCRVWRHQERSKSAAYRAKTLRAIEDAQIVIVLWSKTSSTSPWVLDEADAGMRKGASVAVEIGTARSPLGYSGTQRVRVETTDTGLSPHDETEIWEVVLDVAGPALPGQRRRVWLDRSAGAVLLNVLANLALFGSLGAAAAAAQWPGFFLGPSGVALSVSLGLATAGCGYAGDWLSQRLGTRLRAFRQRLLFRWCTESVGGGMAAFLFVVILRQMRHSTQQPWLTDALEIFLGGFSVLSAVLLTVKYVPLLVSGRLQRRLLGRPC